MLLQQDSWSKAVSLIYIVCISVATVLIMLQCLFLQAVSGQGWKNLYLSGNHIIARGVERLMQANWHELCGLTLDIKAISKAMWHHLGLPIDAMPNPAEVAQGCHCAKKLGSFVFSACGLALLAGSQVCV